MDTAEVLLIQMDEDAVVSFLESLGFPYYEDQIKEHNITGEILVHLDHEALKDVGIHSVGQRLAILRAVYALKVQQNVPVEGGHYVPPSEEMEHMFIDGSSAGAAPSNSDRDTRIHNLELEVQRLHDSLAALQDTSASRPAVKVNAVRSPTSNVFHHPLSNVATHPTLPPKSRIQDSLHPLPESPPGPMGSPRIHEEVDAGRLTYSAAGDYSIAPFTSGSLTPVTPTAPPLETTTSYSSTTSSQLLPSTAGPSTSSSPLPPIPSGSGSRPSTSTDRERSDRQGASSGSDNPYRSFRVTLEDPCYKVLPAALKKYKINDDWRQYALFICYGNTERCLSYDEKPLLLFQRLKEGNANPVFMLRHIKDIKSPIAVASAKHALRRDKRAANAGAGLDKPPATTREGVPISRANRLHQAPVLLPLGKDKEKMGGEGEEELSPASPREAPGYCISIYPYLAEREDEFDVSVGDTFVIISKTKGWWVVHRDFGPSNALDTSARKSAWVPAGCLLETNVPPLSLADPTHLAHTSPYNAASVPIEPSCIVSVSTPGVALMDYSRNGSDELDVKKGTPLRILKRYNHWSYAIKDDGQRGWIPSWFCGRAARGELSPTTPTTSSGPARSTSGSIAPSLQPIVSGDALEVSFGDPKAVSF